MLNSSGALSAKTPPGTSRRNRRDMMHTITSTIFSLILALSTPLSGIGAQMAWAEDASQASFDVVEEGVGGEASDPASDETGSLDPPAEEGAAAPAEPAAPATGTGGMDVSEDGVSPAQPSQGPADSSVTEDPAPSQETAPAANPSLEVASGTSGWLEVTVSGAPEGAVLEVDLAEGKSVDAAALPAATVADEGGYTSVTLSPVSDGTLALPGVKACDVSWVGLWDGSAWACEVLPSLAQTSEVPKAELSACDTGLGFYFPTVTLSGTTGPATLRVKAAADGVLATCTTGSSQAQDGSALSWSDVEAAGDGAYTLVGVDLSSVDSVCLVGADGSETVLLDAAAVAEQLAQIPEASRYVDPSNGAGYVEIGGAGVNPTYKTISVGYEFTNGTTWDFPYAMFDSGDGTQYYIQCVSPLSAARFNAPRYVSGPWATDASVRFLEYVGSRGMATSMGWSQVPSDDPGRQAMLALAQQSDATNKDTGQGTDTTRMYAAEHFVMSAAFSLMVKHGATVFETSAPNDVWVAEAVRDATEGYNVNWDNTCRISMSAGLSYEASCSQLGAALKALWGQYSASGYDRLMAGLTVQSFIGSAFDNSKPLGFTGYTQNIYGYIVQGSAKGYIELWKYTTSPDAAGASYGGAVYGVYSDEACTKLVTKMTTEQRSTENGLRGYAMSEALAPGTYWVKEISASAGFAVDAEVKEATVTAAGVATVKSDEPVPQRAGALELYKVSAKPEVTTGNACYSLKGAVYGVYSDEACTQAAGSLETGDDGHAVSGPLPAGTYWVREDRPSPGFAKDTGTYKATVVAGKTTRVGGAKGALKEQPQNDPVAITVQKVDSKTGEKVPVGDASLEGAEFTVRYYAGQYSDASQLPLKAARTWVIRTNKDGFTQLLDSYKVSGDDFYVFNGRVSVPLGTITVQETKAPAGYDVNPEVFLRNITGDGSGSETVNVDMTFQIPESAQMGGLSVQKSAAGDLPEGATLAGIEFQVFNGSSEAVAVGGETYAPETAETVAAGTARAILTLTTDEAGFAATAADALPFGTYIVHESRVPASTCTAATAPDQTVQVRTAGAVTPCEADFVNDLAHAGLSLQKLDAQSADEAAQGSATLKGAEFEVRGADDLTVLTLVTDDLGRASTGADALPLGTYRVVETKAPDGYGLPADEASRTQEVTLSAPGEVVTLQVPFRDAVLRGGVSVQKADVETGSTGPQGGASFEGAKFEVSNANAQPVVVNGVAYAQDDVVTTLVTDSTGSAATDPGLLPVGTYTVRETKAPKGYNVNPDEWTVQVSAGRLSPVGQAAGREGEQGAQGPLEALAALFAPSTANAEEADGTGEQEGGVSVAEQVVRGGVRVYKVDADTGSDTPQGDATLEGCEFTISSMNRNPVVVDGVEYEYGSDVKKIYTDRLGVAQTGERDLPYGTYRVRETSAPTGYRAMGQVFEISQDGVVVEVGEKFENQVKRGGIAVQKVDAETSDGSAQGGATLAGTVFEVVNASGEAVVVDGRSYEPGDVVTTLVTNGDGFAATGDEALPYGTYTVREAKAPSGYLDGEDGSEQTALVRDGGTVVACADEFENRVKRGGLSLHKADAETADGSAQGAAALAGAEFEVANANGQPVVVDGVEYAPGEAVLTLVTDEAGDAATQARALPVGTYTVREVKAPEGYDPDPAAQTVTVVEDGETVACGADFKDSVVRGGFGLRKADSETGESSAQGDATLAGAVFEVVNANEQPVVFDGVEHAKGEVVTTIETDATGWAQVPGKSLPYGTYTVREVKAPSGYRVGDADGSRSSLEVTVEGKGWWRSFEAGEMADQVVRGGLSLHKADAQTSDGAAQGGATLAGAKFEVVNASASAVQVGGVSYAPGEVVLTLVTDGAGDASTGARDLPYGTYKVHEKTPPAGYAPDSGEQVVQVRSEAQTVACGSPFRDQVLRGGASVGKTDSETGRAQAQGSATLQGAVFEVVSDNDQPVIVSGQAYAKGDVVARITTDAAGCGSTAADALPYGSYKVRETVAPQGYLVNTTVWSIEVSRAGELVPVGDAGDDPDTGTQDGADGDAPEAQGDEAKGPLEALAAAFGPSTANAAEADTGEAEAPSAVVPEQVVRGDVQLVKVREGDMAALAGVPFLVTSETTGEAHVVVTGPDGSFDSSARPHSSSTNANDAAYDASAGTVDDAALDASAGTWFSGAETGSAPADDSRGALPYDTYTMVELPCAANAGLRMVTLRFTVAADKVKVDLGTVADRAAPALATELLDADGRHDAYAMGQATLTDRVDYGHFDAGDYTAVLELVLDDGTPLLDVEGNPVGATVAFTAEGESGTFEASASFDCSALAGRSVTAFETVYAPDGAEVASHRDLGDEGQTVTFHGLPSLSTTLAGEGGEKVVAAEGGRVTLVDTVAYEGLVPGRAYILVGALMDKSTGEALLDAEGSPVTASAEISPTEASGTAAVTFALDEAVTSGRGLVAFETLSIGGTVLASHADIDDEAQTAWVPAVGTALADAASGTRMAVAAEGTSLVDTVSWSGLMPGETYTLVGTLMDRETGEALAGADGQPVTASTEFAADSASGTATVTFAVDAAALAGRTVVAFEHLELGGTAVASHEDIDDEAQSVRFPRLETEFAQTDGSHAVLGEGAHDLVDTVSWSNLAVGAQYRLVCALADPETGEHLRHPETGEKYEASADFTAEGESGRTQVAFPDLTGLTDRRAVALESLYTLGPDGSTWVEVGRHRDVADTAQTVSFGKPVVRTVLTGTDNGLHEVGATSKVTLVDTVAYEGVEAGATYELKGTLMDKSTGEALVSRGQKVEAAAQFTAEGASGTATVTFTFDASDLGGKRVVAYETLSRDGQEVARHESMEDADQTVSLVRVRTTATDASDGDHEVAAQAKASLADRVEVWGLEAGATYTIVTELADASAKETVATSSANVVPSRPDTAFTVKAEVDTSKYAGRDLVFLETVKRDGKVVAEHRDYSDVGQTVRVGASIGTVLTGQSTGSHEAAPGKVTLVDTVEYRGLVAGSQYALTGELRYADGTAVPGDDGKPLVSHATFTPAEAAGTAAVAFSLDASAMADGTKVVAFETLADNNGRTVAEHKDLSDEAQTVTFHKTATPSSGTTVVTSMPQTGQGLAWAAGIAAGLAAAVLGGFYAVKGRLPFSRRGEGAEAVEPEEPCAEGEGAEKTDE